jgi:RNA polymerase sigma-70 factor (ECF subfamily)
VQLVEPSAGWLAATPLTREAVESAYRAVGPRLVRFAQALGADRDEALEAVQEAFLRLLREPSLYDSSRGSLDAFLYGMTRNRVRELRREPMVEPVDDEIAETGEGLLEGLAQKARIEQVRQAIASLPMHYREALVLVELEEQSYEVAAQALGVAIGTVRSRLSRARALLEQKLRGLS